jgi:hypothetical protein
MRWLIWLVGFAAAFMYTMKHTKPKQGLSQSFEKQAKKNSEWDHG